MQVTAWNRTPRPGEALVELDELLTSSDVISCTSRSRRYKRISRAGALARMKPGVVLINTARGALVDETASLTLCAAAASAMPASDVFHAEPLRPDHPLAAMATSTITAMPAFARSKPR